MDFNLASSTIGAIREFIDSQTSRGDLKSLALKAGASSERVMRIKISGNMKDPNYRSKTQLMGEIVDTVYEDFEKPEADGIFLRMTDHLLRAREEWRPAEEIENLERGLAASNLTIAQIMGSTGACRITGSHGRTHRNLGPQRGNGPSHKGTASSFYRQTRSHYRLHQRLRVDLPKPHSNGLDCHSLHGNSYPTTSTRFAIKPTLWPSRA